MIGRHGTEDHGAFVVVTHSRAGALREALARRAIIADARGPYLRLCQDILTTDEEIVRAADALAELAR